MFKIHSGNCSCCGKPGLIVVKKGLRHQCNEEQKRAKKSGRNDASIRNGNKPGNVPVREAHEQDIEGYTTVFRQPIRKKKKPAPKRSGNRTPQDQIRKKVDFGRAGGLLGIRKEHTRVYYASFGYTVADFVPCEICGLRAVDINHIDCRGMGGTDDPLYNSIENLMGTCRDHHVQYGDKKEFRPFLIETHFEFMSANGVKYDKEFFEKWQK